MEKRTIIDFSANGDIQKVFDEWAKKNKFNLKRQEGNIKTYQKGTGLWVAPTMFVIKQDNQNVHLEIWIRSNFFVRLGSLFILPEEICISSGGFKAVLPRTRSRNIINELLRDLGVPVIQ